MALTGKNNEEKIWNFLSGKGLSAYGVAGLMGNLYAESALDPENLQNTSERRLSLTDEEYTAAVDSGIYTNFVRDSAGYGLAQWTYWSRKEALLAYAKAEKASIGDLEMQLGFLYKELSESYASVLAKLKTATSVQEASDVVLTKFERPANQGDPVKAKRASYGQKYFDKYAAASSDNSEGGTKNMTVKIGHASSDENGKSKKGTAGDQTGKEVFIRDWYEKNWTVLLRPKSASVAEKLAKACEAACKNPKIGYDQSQRNTLRAQAKAAGWDLSKITTACECDCSSLMTVCAEAAGIDMDDAYTSGNAPATGNMRKKFKATGAFTVHTASKYLKSPDYLKRGDIIVREPGHTFMVLSNGSKVKADSASSSGSTSSGSSASSSKTTSSGSNSTSSSSKLAFKVGAVVQFTGSRHYGNANALTGPKCKPGKAKVTAVYPTGKHPYHLRAVSGSGSTVCGWVNANDLGKLDEIVVGDVVQFAGGPHYTSANAKSSKKSPKAGPAKVTAIKKGAKHPYHIVHTTGASSVYGWVDADKVSK